MLADGSNIPGFEGSRASGGGWGRARVGVAGTREAAPIFAGSQVDFGVRIGMQEQAAATLNALYGLHDDPARISRAMVNRTTHVSADELKGLTFRIDPAFFIHDLSTHNAKSLLASASRHTHVRIVHTGCGGSSHGAVAAGGAPWGAARAAELATELMDGGAFDVRGISLGDRSIRYDDEQSRIATVIAELAHSAGTDQARRLRAAALAKPPPSPAKAAALTASAEALKLSDELEELQGKGEDVYALGALGRSDRASLKVKLKELGYKSMRARVKLEEELIALPPRK